MLAPTSEESLQRERVLAALRTAIAEGTVIRLPRFDPELSVAAAVAPVSAGAEPNPYGLTIGPYRCQFEGEDDLLHAMVVRQDQGELSVEEAQAVFGWMLPEVPLGVVWVKPGSRSHHFYLGHELLL